MRTTSLVLAASLALAPGCAQLVLPPVLGGTAGAGIGAAISDREDRGGAMVVFGVLGVLVGVFVDVLIAGYIIADLSKKTDDGGAVH